MIGEKNINRLTIILVSCMVGLTAILVYVSKDETILTSLTATEQPKYVEKIFNQDELLEIDIQISDENWNHMIENATDEEYVMADIVINGEVYQSVGIRPKGNSSLTTVASDSTTDRYSFKVDFSEYVNHQTLYGLKKIVLNNMIGDATYMKEYLSYEMFSAMGIATPAFSYANISVNGEPWGLYLALEVMEESFVQRYFGTISGSLYKPESMDMVGGGDKENMMGEKPFNQGFNKLEQNQMPLVSIEEQSPDITRQDENSSEEMIPPSGEVSEGMTQPSGEMPEGMIPPSGEVSEGVTPPSGEASEGMMPPSGEMPEGMTQPSGEMPEGMTPPSGEASEGMMPPSGEASEGMTPPSGEMSEGKMMGGTSSAGSSLVYTDDKLSSYSAIFDNSVLKGTTEAAYDKVIEMMKNLNAGTNLEQYLDIEEILRYFAVNTFLVNLDSYAGSLKHNYYLYEENGVFQILPWDLNLSFGTFQMSDANKVINFPIDEPVTDTMENSPLISKLLEVDEYKEMYHLYLEELIDVYIESGRYAETIEKLQLLISEAVKEDQTAFYTYEEFLESLPHLAAFGYDRATSIKAQLAEEQPSETYGTIETTVDIAALGSQNNGNGGKEIMALNPSDSEANPNISDKMGKDNVQNTFPDDLVNHLDTSSNEMLRPSHAEGQMMDPSLIEGLQTIMGSIDVTRLQQLVLHFAGKTQDSITEEDQILLSELGIEEELVPTLLAFIETDNPFLNRGEFNSTKNQLDATNGQLMMAFMAALILLPATWFVSHYKKRRFTS